MNEYINGALSALDQVLIGRDMLTGIAVARRHLLLALEAETERLPEIEPIEGPTERMRSVSDKPTTNAKRTYNKSGKTTKAQTRAGDLEAVIANGGRLPERRPTDRGYGAQVKVMGGPLFSQHVECSVCGAAPGYACKNVMGKNVGQYTLQRHEPRVELARQRNAEAADDAMVDRAVGALKNANESATRWFPTGGQPEVTGGAA